MTATHQKDSWTEEAEKEERCVRQDVMIKPPAGNSELLSTDTVGKKRNWLQR